MLLGCYEKFPEDIHSIALLQHENQTKSLQEAILRTFYRLNNETFDLGSVTPYLNQCCEVGFEFGVAEGLDFVFLDHPELEQCLKCVAEQNVELLDFFFVVRYHLVNDGKRVPLRFDYHLLRFVFYEGSLEIRVRHEKGTQRVLLDELTRFVVKQINVELVRMQLLPLVFGDFKKVNVK